MSLNLKMEYDEATLENLTLQMKGTSKELLKGKNGDDGAEISEIKTSEKNLKKDMEKQAKKTKTKARKMAKPQKTKEPPKIQAQAVVGEMRKQTSEEMEGVKKPKLNAEKIDSSKIKKKKRRKHYYSSDSDSDTTGTETTSSDSDSCFTSSDSE